MCEGQTGFPLRDQAQCPSPCTAQGKVLLEMQALPPASTGAGTVYEGLERDLWQMAQGLPLPSASGLLVRQLPGQEGSRGCRAWLETLMGENGSSTQGACAGLASVSSAHLHSLH